MVNFVKTSPIDALLNSGADAYKNIWYSKIEGMDFTSWGDGENVMFRAEGFNLPKFSTEGDERTLWGKKIKTPKPEVNMERTFTITYRMDANYALYDDFKTELHKVVNGQNSSSNTLVGISNWIDGNITVTVYGLKGVYNGTGETGTTSELTTETFTKEGASEVWTFNNCWIADVSEPSFARDDASIVTFEVKFNFAGSDYKEHLA